LVAIGGDESRPSGRGRLSGRFARLVPGVVFGFQAVVLEQIGVRKKLLDEVDRDRPGKGFLFVYILGELQME
jgi:hypothetical protein